MDVFRFGFICRDILRDLLDLIRVQAAIHSHSSPFQLWYVARL